MCSSHGIRRVRKGQKLKADSKPDYAYAQAKYRKKVKKREEEAAAKAEEERVERLERDIQRRKKKEEQERMGKTHSSLGLPEVISSEPLAGPGSCYCMSDKQWECCTFLHLWQPSQCASVLMKPW
jgi:hypothetical protein